MLRAGIQPDHFHQRQVGTLPGQFGLRVTEIAEGRFCGELELQPWMWAPNGYLHAASVIVLADTCCRLRDAWRTCPTGRRASRRSS